MTKSEFKRAMRCGLGRSVTELAADAEKHKQTVLWGCLNNLSFDIQCEGTRAEYVYRLVRSYSDPEYFLAPAVDKFDHLQSTQYPTFMHLSELLTMFACDGIESAKAALYRKYDRLLEILRKRRTLSRYDAERDSFEATCICLTSIDGFSAYKKIARDIGTLLVNSRYYADERFDWFCENARERFGRRKIHRFFNAEKNHSQEINAFSKSVQTYENFTPAKTEPPSVPTADKLAVKKEITLFEKMLFSRLADPTEKIKLARAAIEQPDADRKAKLLSVFRKFPIGCEKIVEYAHSENEQLREAAFNILTSGKDPVIRGFALGLIQKDERVSEAICMLINNYNKDDKALLLSLIGQIKIDSADSSGWHWIMYTIIDAFDSGVHLPKEFLYYIYNYSLCSCCREYAIRIMAKHKWLTRDIVEECRSDSRSEIREYINRYYK